MKYIKSYKIFESNETFNQKEYLKWKRKNVTLRGVKELGKENGAGARFGNGLYQSYLSNKTFAKSYGTVYFVVNGRGENPKVVQSPNSAEIFLQNLKRDYCREHNLKHVTDFYKHTTVEDEMIRLGYDSLDISGCELVNFKPDMSKIKYFRTEDELKNYYIHNVKI